MIANTMYEIIWGRVPLGRAGYERFGVIVGIMGPNRTVFPICTDPTERERIGAFRIHKLDEGFADTGLDHTSYVLGTAVDIHERDVVKHKGELKGKLLERFKRWMG